MTAPAVAKYPGSGWLRLRHLGYILTNNFSDAPRITSQSQELSLGEGESVLLPCRVTANPPATVEWVRQNSGQVVGEGEELALAPLNRSLADTYICQARNSLGLSEPLAHTLTIQCKSHCCVKLFVLWIRNDLLRIRIQVLIFEFRIRILPMSFKQI